MKPVYYKVNDSCYKLVIDDDVSQDQIDACLDAIGFKNTTFITKEEFESRYEKYMDIEVWDTSDSFKIGTLSTEYLDIEEGDLI